MIIQNTTQHVDYALSFHVELAATTHTATTTVVFDK
jgi:hypothetical protein